MKTVILQKEHSYREYPLADRGTIGTKEYRIEDGILFLDCEEIRPYCQTQLEEESVIYIPEEHRDYERKPWVFLSGEAGDIRLPGCGAKIFIRERQIQVERSQGSLLYLNQTEIGDGTYPLEAGDILLIDACKLQIGKRQVTIWGKDYECGLLPVSPQNEKMPEFPHYKRSPRIIKRVEDKKVRIEGLQKESDRGRRGLLQTILPPLGMLAVTVGIGVLMGRGIYMLLSVSATFMTTLFSVVKFFQDKKERKVTAAKKKELYGNYLLKKRKEICRQYESEKEAYAYNYPQVKDLAQMVEEYDSRIYERSSLDDDFLTFSAGHCIQRTAFSIEDKSSELEIDVDEYQKDVQELKEKYTFLDKPQIVDLKKAHLGLVGEKSVIHEQLKNLIAQIAFFQSYHDVQIIAVYSQEYEKDFAWMRWLSHARLRGLNVQGMICSEKTRDQVLSSLQQILKERRQKVIEEKKEGRFLPHYLFLIDEPKMLMDHSIMEFLGSGMGDKLGFSIVYTSSQQANLPEYIGSVLLLENSEEGRMLLNEKEHCNRKLRLYRIGDTDLERMARNLGVLIHDQRFTSHIPESITFFEMYGIQHPEELHVRERWRKNNSSKTLAVPLGARAAGDYLELNLHEKAHGPHGLVAGTTGSGKSEIVQSYILSLAVNFHPHEVGFLLIDYKGGGMANLFKDLPHLLGTITNLDGSESMRALVSIQSELKRRQRVFQEYDVNHINAYNDLFKEGKAKEPIPHLFIISDEFAELKKEQPEFMKELVSTARIGRSLGVHLILATQKPSGVVDDQIWTNSKFKLCLKVQNEADSKEVLHTPDAANITQVGRAYLQVGNNEIYELFQSAWSGAAYVDEAEKEVTQDNRVYLVNELGQGMLINQDLRGTKEERKARKTQLDVVVEHIRKVYDAEACAKVSRPWLPSLPERICNPYREMPRGKETSLGVRLGIVDIPEEQKQEEYVLDLVRDGNVAYIASSGYGKSVFLANVALDLAVHNQVRDLNLYILDFGNNALIAFKSLPHTADYIMLDDAEKFKKFRGLMTAETTRRKKLLAEAMVQNFAVYNEVSQTPLKAIAILIDNYDAVREMGYETENYFTKLSRDGTGLGIYIIMAASRTSAVRAATMNNFKNKIAGYNFEENEVKSLVGKSAYTLPDIRGRAMVKTGEQGNLLQLYTPVDFRDEVEYSKNLQAFINEVREKYPGEEAPHIPVLPEKADYESIAKESDSENICLGLDWETVETRKITPDNTPFLILGEAGSGKTNVLRIILDALKGIPDVYLIDSRSRNLYEYREQVHYLSGKQEIDAFANAILEEKTKRQNQLKNGLLEKKTPEEILRKMAPYYVVVDDIDDFCMQAEAEVNIIGSRFEQAAMQGIRFIATADINRFKGTDSFTKYLKSARDGMFLSNPGFQPVLPAKPTETLGLEDGFLIIGGKGNYIRIPKAGTKRGQNKRREA